MVEKKMMKSPKLPKPVLFPNQTYLTQWAGQFGVASELSKRGYEVTFTMGNNRSADLFVRSQSGVGFAIEIKSQISENFWLITPVEPKPLLFYILVIAPLSNVPNTYFILYQDEVNELVSDNIQRARARAEKRGEIYKKPKTDFGFNSTLHRPFIGKWDRLPK